MAEERIVDKIAKLLELADETRGGTPAERENATKRAHEMMLKYNVEQAEIDGRSAEGEVGEDSHEISGTQDEWKVRLPILLGEACFVGGYYQPLARFRWRVILVGRAENIAFVRTLCDQLIPWLESEAALAFTYAKEGGNVKPRSFKRAFFHAATVTILARLKAEREEVTGNGMELVRTEDAANAKYIEDTAGNIKTEELRGYSSVAGRYSGQEAGLRADLATPQGKAVE
jgi:hypothetical protein